MGKKIFIGVSVLFFLLIAAVVAIPFVIDIDKYRPEIVAIANEQINGEIQIEKLSLSLWGQIKVVVNGLSVKDKKGENLVSVGETFVHLPFSSILGGAPHLTIKIDEPNINIKKYKNGSINLLSIVKPSDAKEAKATEKTSKPVESTEPVVVDNKVMQYINQSTVDLELTNSVFKFHDLASEFQTQVSGFNVLLTDISMSKTMTLKIWTTISTKIGKDLSVDGPFSINGTLTPEFDGLDFKHFSTKMKLDFDSIVVEIPKTFRKEKGQPTNIDLEATVGLKEVLVKKLEIHFLDVNAYADASLKNLASPPEKIAFNLKADKPGVDLDLKLKVSSITTPDIDLVLNSSGIDMDVLFPPSPEAIKERERLKKLEEEQKKSGKTPVAEEEAPPVDVDGMLAPLKTDPLLKGMKAKANIAIKQFKGFNIVANDIVVKNTYANLKAALDQFSVNIFGGSIGLNAAIDLGADRPEYNFGAKIDSIDLGGALISQFDTLANTLKGFLSFDLKGAGKSLNSDLLIRNLDAKGEFAVKKAEFATFDVGKMAHEALTSAVGDIEKKYPQLKDKVKLGGLKDQVSRYDVIGGHFSMKNGEFKAPDFAAVSEPEKGIDITGNTEVNLVEDKLFARWALVDTYNQTKLGDVSIKQTGFVIEGLFKEGGVKPIEFPVEVGCKLSEPCFKYDSVPGHLLGVAKDNISKAANGLLDAEKKKLQARLDAEKKKLKDRADAEKKKLEEAKQKKLAELDKKKKELEKKKKEEEEKAKKKAEEEAKKKLKGKFGKKLGF